MILDWPATLPRPERATWQARPQEARRRRQGDTGPPAYRRRFSAVPQVVSLSLILSRADRQIFDTFFAVDCARGAHLFRMPDPTTDGWPALAEDGTPILTGSGAPLLLSSVWLCAWGDEPPVETLEGLEFRKSFNVVVIP
jgi:hypothetical protein